MKKTKKVLFVCVENSCRSQSDLSVHSSKSLTAVPDVEYDHSITMGCGDECPYVKEKQRQDWAIPDSKNMNDQDFDKVRDTIETKVLPLIDSMNTEE